MSAQASAWTPMQFCDNIGTRRAVRTPIIIDLGDELELRAWGKYQNVPIAKSLLEAPRNNRTNTKHKIQADAAQTLTPHNGSGVWKPHKDICIFT